MYFVTPMITANGCDVNTAREESCAPAAIRCADHGKIWGAIPLPDRPIGHRVRGVQPFGRRHPAHDLTARVELPDRAETYVTDGQTTFAANCQPVRAAAGRRVAVTHIGLRLPGMFGV